MSRLLMIVALLCVTACTNASDPEEPNDGEPKVESITEADSPRPDPDIPADDGADGDASDPCAVVDQARLVRTQSVPGGRRLHLQVVDSDRNGVPADVTAACLTVTSERLGELSTSVSTAPRAEGATLIVAQWGPDSAEPSRWAIDALIAALPAGERIAVWAWSTDLVQVVGATSDRGRLARRLGAVWSADAAPPLEPQDAAEIASEEWEDFADDVLLGSRSVVFIAPELDLGERPDIDRDVVVDHWIVRSGDGGRVTELDSADLNEVDRAATAVGERIESDARADLSVVDVCDDGEALELTLSVGDSELRDFRIGDAAAEHVGVPCGNEVPPAPLSIKVAFDAAEQAVFAEAVAIADELSGLDRFEGDVDPEWVGSIGFGDGPGSSPFEASFRGQSSIECERRNWAIDLDGGDARHPIPDSGIDEFVLASLCNDAGYVNTLIGSAVMAEFDLWAQATGTGVLDVDGTNRGVYLVIEDPDVDLRFETSRVDTVLRRRYDVLDVLPDVEYVADLTSNDEASVLAGYDDLAGTAAATSGDEMVAALRARFDLDQYLRWTAVMSLMGSGDHIDELYFVGSESVDADHEPITWFTVNGWDPDDLFAECHRDGRFAIDDPNGLLSCTESLLDRELFADPVVYELFVTELEGVIDTMTGERFAQIAIDAADQVTMHFDAQDGARTSDAMVEFDPPVATPDDASAAVNAAADELLAEFGNRRAQLVDAVGAYRSGG